MINRERPIHIEKFITDNIEKVAREITKNGSTLILAPAGFSNFVSLINKKIQGNLFDLVLS